MPGTLPATAPWPAAADLRAWLALLEREGQLGVVRSPIDPDQDVAAVLEQADGCRAVLFTDVLGADFPLVGNAVLDRAGLARAMGCGPRETVARFAAALDAPRPCREVQLGDAPVFANRMDGDRLLSRLPIPVQHERDAGRYLTSALLAVRDPVSGVMNLSINRMLAVGERELRVLVLAGRLRGILAQAEQEGRDLDAAVLIGVDPLLELASQAPADRDLADLEVAGALGPGPLSVVACPTVDAVVPAGVEFVLEGRFRAGARAPEGPFGEFPRTYGPGGPVPVLELSAGWHRDDAVAQTVLSGGREHFLVGGVPREAALARALARTFGSVTGVRLPESGSCRLTAVVALHEPGPGTAVDVIMAVFALSTLVKSVVVVDHDVDIHDDEDVAWAVATRVRAECDLLVVPRSRGSSLDPTTVDGTVTKLGIDATVPPSERERYARMRVAPSDAQTIGRHLAEAGVPVRSRGARQ